MAKHAATTTRTIAPARGSERTIRADLRSRLLSGFLVTGRRLSLTNLSTAVLEGDDGSPIVLLRSGGVRGTVASASNSIDRAPDREFVSDVGSA